MERFRADGSLRTHVLVQFRRLWQAVGGPVPPMSLSAMTMEVKLDE
jgi:hypothetical protein